MEKLFIMNVFTKGNVNLGIDRVVWNFILAVHGKQQVEKKKEKARQCISKPKILIVISQ